MGRYRERFFLSSNMYLQYLHDIRVRTSITVEYYTMKDRILMSYLYCTSNAMWWCAQFITHLLLLSIIWR